MLLQGQHTKGLTQSLLCFLWALSPLEPGCLAIPRSSPEVLRYCREVQTTSFPNHFISHVGSEFLWKMSEQPVPNHSEGGQVWCMLPSPSSINPALVSCKKTDNLLQSTKGNNLSHLRMSQVWMESPQAGLAAGLAPFQKD